jgi:hypothetical protein
MRHENQRSTEALGWSPTFVARLLCAAASLGIGVYVYIATGRALVSVAIYALSVVGAAVTLLAMGCHLTPVLERAVDIGARGLFGWLLTTASNNARASLSARSRRPSSGQKNARAGLRAVTEIVSVGAAQPGAGEGGGDGGPGRAA